MKEQHLAYFRDIGMSRAAISRAIDLHDLLQRVSPIDVEDVFVNDIISEEGVRTQESLWLFGENRVSEFKNMLTVVNFDFLNMSRKPLWVDVNTQDYNFDEFNDNSRLNVNITIKYPLGMHLKAARNNCPHLANLLKTRFSVD